jgi:myo-inositol-1(or 4)-monophosphatase
MEAMAIVATITPDPELLAAAALHDTVEDTDITLDVLRAEFGERVAKLVADESDVFIEGASEEESWHQRKQAAIDRLASASVDAKVVALGDKLSNMYGIAIDYRKIGDEVWELFHAPNGKSDVEWYYRSLGEALSELSDTLAYQKFVALLEEVFG